jgi:hypothetical protein
MFEMFNEGEWYDQSDRRQHEEHFLEFFRTRTDALLLTNSDHISGDDPHNNPNVSIISFHGSSWTGEHQQFVDGFNTAPAKPYFMSEQIPDFNGQNVSVNDIRQGAWEQAMAGAGWVAQNDTSFSWDPNTAITSQIAVRNLVYDQVGHVATFFNDLDVEFWNMVPDPSLASTGIVLGNLGAEYVVYANAGGAFTVDLSTAAGETLSVQWYDPRTGILSTVASIAGGLVNTPFTAPDGNDWVLRLKVESVPELGADFDNDRDVDGGDLTDPVNGWEARFGVDLDGFDFLVWQRQFGSGVPPLSASTALPEPSSIVMLVGLTVAGILARRERCLKLDALELPKRTFINADSVCFSRHRD